MTTGFSLRSGSGLIAPIDACPFDNSDGALYAAYDFVTSNHLLTPTAGTPAQDLTGHGRTLTKVGATAGFGFQAAGFVGDGGNHLVCPFTGDELTASGTPQEFSVAVVARAIVTPGASANSQLVSTLAVAGRSFNILATSSEDMNASIGHGNATRTMFVNNDSATATALPYAGRDTQDMFVALTVSAPRRRIIGYVAHGGGFFAFEDDFLNFTAGTTIVGGGAIRMFLKSASAINATIGKTAQYSDHELSPRRIEAMFEEQRYHSRGYGQALGG